MTAKSFLLGGAAVLALTLAACDNVRVPGGDDSVDATVNEAVDVNVESQVDVAALEGNPFLEEWDTPYGVPPFALIGDEDFMPAVQKGIADLEAEIAAITGNNGAPNFQNTIVAMDRAGGTLGKVMAVFGAITNTDTNDALSALEGDIYPMVSQVSDAIYFNDELFTRVKSVYNERADLGLDEQDARLVELVYRQFERAGATLSTETKAEVSEINTEISSLTTSFGQNLLKSTKAFKVEITDEAELVGLSDDFKAAIQDGDTWTLTVDRSVYETFMTQSENRELRKTMFDGYRLRASSGEYDNGPNAIKMAQLRAKRAELLGYRTHAEYILEYNMAKTPEAVEQFLVRVWQPGLAQAKEERATMQTMIGDEFQFAGHDWWHYSEKVRQDKYAFDDTVLKPYFELNAVREGAFDVAEKLFEITIEPVEIEGWNPVVTSYDVKDAATGEHLGLFMMDMYARESKRGGAWMSGFRSSTNYDGETEIRPIITNNLNLITPPEGSPTLMRFGEVSTLFHEFGHGLHGLLTQMKYETFSGVDGPRDYTEFPAQLLEHWAGAPETLAQYALHNETGEAIPLELIERMREASNHNQGFATTEYIAASLLDLNWHNLTYDQAMEITDAREFEVATLAKYGLIPEIEPRYRTQYFSHIFAGGYSSGYYAYLWSAILDNDGFAAFEDAGDIFDPVLAAKLKKWVYESGGLRPADELYREFRGSDPTIEPLLRSRGFSVDETEG